MKLNEQATIELTASIWLVIAQDGLDKAEALQSLGFRSNTVFVEDEGFVFDFAYDCPCCEHVAQQGKEPRGSIYGSEIRECDQVCLLHDLWPKGCEHYTSFFKAWQTFSEITTEKRQYAMGIAMFSGILAGTWSMELEELLWRQIRV